MNPSLEDQYKALSKKEQDEHHKQIRDELIEKGIIKPQAK